MRKNLFNIRILDECNDLVVPVTLGRRPHGL